MLRLELQRGVSLDSERRICDPSKTGRRDINDTGVIVGTYVLAGIGFHGGRYTELPPLTGPWSWATAINNAGVVAGARTIRDDTAPFNAYVWSTSDGFVDLGTMSGPFSFANDINDPCP